MSIQHFNSSIPNSLHQKDSYVVDKAWPSSFALFIIVRRIAFQRFNSTHSRMRSLPV